jgi:Zn-dependent peptidase ImmA (M78 family)
MGEIKAEKIQCADYDRGRLMQELRSIRNLTSKPIEEFLPELEKRCAVAGVAFIIEKPLKGIALSGISRWMNPKRAIVQQTLRHLSDDHFWFTFFHECAHLLLHSRKSVFIDANGNGNAEPEEEAEANDWAANFLVPDQVMTRFITRFNYSEDEVIQFAAEQGVAPGIIVGQLQHRKVLGFHQMNSCKKRYQWAS